MSTIRLWARGNRCLDNWSLGGYGSRAQPQERNGEKGAIAALWCLVASWDLERTHPSYNLGWQRGQGETSRSSINFSSLWSRNSLEVIYQWTGLPPVTLVAEPKSSRRWSRKSWCRNWRSSCGQLWNRQVQALVMKETVYGISFPFWIQVQMMWESLRRRHGSCMESSPRKTGRTLHLGWLCCAREQLGVRSDNWTHRSWRTPTMALTICCRRSPCGRKQLNSRLSNCLRKPCSRLYRSLMKQP